MTYGTTTETQTLNLLPDPRVVRDGVTVGVMKEQLAHNLQVRDLVSDASVAVMDLAALSQRGPATPEFRQRVDAIANVLLTPPVRYSKPGLQSHIQYLYGETTGADEKVGRDAIERYRALRSQLDSVRRSIAEIRIP